MFLVFLLAALACVSAAPDDKGPREEFWGYCPPGYYHGSNLAEGALPCLPCPPGTFQPEYNRHEPCQPHRECKKPGEILLDPGTSLVDAICQCENGTQRTGLWSIFGESYHCTKCAEGEISHEVPGEPGDTICCPPHLPPVMAPNARHFTCETPSEHQPPPTPNDTSPTVPSRDTSPDSDEPETDLSEPARLHASSADVVGGVLGGIVLPLCLVVLAVVVCYGRAHPESVWGGLLPKCLAPRPRGAHPIEGVSLLILENGSIFGSRVKLLGER